MYLEVTISLRQDLLYISQDESNILEIFQVALLHKIVECYRRKDKMVIHHTYRIGPFQILTIARIFELGNKLSYFSF